MSIYLIYMRVKEVSILISILPLKVYMTLYWQYIYNTKCIKYHNRLCIRDECLFLIWETVRQSFLCSNLAHVNKAYSRFDSQ
ncbi:hypothetical protein SAMN05216232_2553 [Virgibacillus subterraneus]|uniref:Uncharacterized protein n=1 Tax=Virgibacillus subterraneus TaxID=621109 RepID=A0A1H9GC70_9BACI|nr:hypothetical protein SAMN05216232_2553 [Virgibacillus subterraneus]